MKILLTNDDGIDAPGLAALKDAVCDFGDVTIVAPDRHHSGCSHRTTVHQPLRIIEHDTNRYSIDGTPADCTRVAIHHLLPDVDWIVAGINDGGNLGVDVFMSGTVAAAREASIYLKPAIAFSQYRRSDQDINWQTSTKIARKVFTDLLQEQILPGTFWNVNLPHVTEGEPTKSVHCRLDPHPLDVSFEIREGALHYQGVYQNRRRHPDSDVANCFAGHVTITQLKAIAS